MFLIDTNICICAMKGTFPPLGQRLLEEQKSIFVSSVTVGELEYGAAKSRWGERTRQIFQAFLANYEIIPFVPPLIMMIFSVLMFLNPAYFAQHGDREANCYNALFITNPDANKKLCVLDCDQQYLLKFGWGIECENTDPVGCDYVLIDRNMMEPGYSGYDAWKFYQNYDTIPWDYINSELYIFYENENFVLYKR